MARPQQYDVFRPAALPSASLGRRQVSAGTGPARPDLADQATTDHTSELDKVYDNWNTRIDKEVGAVARGLRELVTLADIGENPTPDTHTLTALHLKLKTSALIRAAQTLRDTAHELRLALALGDDIARAGRRDNEAVAVRAEVDALRRAVACEAGLLVGKAPLVPGERTEDGADAVAGASAGVETGEVGPGAAQPAGESTPPPSGNAAAADGMEVDDEDDEDEFEEV